MNIKNLLLIIFLLTSGYVCSQEYQSPESVVFDPSTYSYFVSNHGDGTIIQIDSTGVKSYFKKGLAKLTGTVIHDNTLYVVGNSQWVWGFNIADGSTKFELQISESKFLNDITTDNSGFLYVTDIGLNKIFKININSGKYSQLVKTKSVAPNGIVYDKFNNRLLVCYFNEKSEIDAVNLKDTSITTVVSTGLSNLDGITIDAEGNVYVSYFGTGDFSNGFDKNGKIYKYDAAFENAPTVILSYQHGPADIFYNKVKDELAVPLFLENRVIFLSLK